MSMHVLDEERTGMYSAVSVLNCGLIDMQHENAFSRAGEGRVPMRTRCFLRLYDMMIGSSDTVPRFISAWTSLLFCDANVSL